MTLADKEEIISKCRTADSGCVIALMFMFWFFRGCSPSLSEEDVRKEIEDALDSRGFSKREQQARLPNDQGEATPRGHAAETQTAE